VRAWASANPEFSSALRDARKAGAAGLLDMAHSAVVDALGEDSGAQQVDSDAGRALARVQPRLIRIGIDGALRLAAKLDPDAFGDRINVKDQTLPIAAILAAADARAAALRSARAPLTIEGEARRVPSEEEVAAGRALLGLD
jgi:hypothetical protein